ncbi:thioredoxin reductase-like selenoprotein T homolog CG3887 [Caerostris extrusa]|uniref:Thioredoxin reductase-like selenoprotein T homolog CG3887 n=1 Tax=Caerostris extrusa TaxID=172846 RepID=A0AAV4XT84_CAEEX|nr:thioredoxin reductase-like selenoprotein T homolog CG3887 [Caerostris extrusa]
MAENGRYVMGGLFILFLAFSAREIFSGTAGNDASFVKEIPKTSFQKAFTGPTLKFLYCFREDIDVSSSSMLLLFKKNIQKLLFSEIHFLLLHSLYACLMVFFLSNTIEGQLISTGAFEIIFNDVPIWSKIETGRLPSPPELFQIIEDSSLFRSTNPSSMSL